MSLARRLDPVYDLLECGSLLSESAPATQLVVIGSINIRGNTYGDSTISTTGTIISQLGDHLEMSNTGQPRQARYSVLPHDTPPPSEKAIDDGGQVSLQSSATDEPPPEYRDRDHDWFTPGRLFRIFAPLDAEIHEKEFVLLDTKNKEGPGLLMRRYDEEEREANRGYFLRAHVSVQNYQSPDARAQGTRLKVVYLDAYEEQDAVPNTWIELEHTYNIPFAKYKCVDCGVLDRGSLQDLRRFYIDWLRYHWGVD